MSRRRALGGAAALVLVVGCGEPEKGEPANTPAPTIAVTTGIETPSGEAGAGRVTPPDIPTAADADVATSHVPGVECVYLQALGDVPDSTVETVRTALIGTYGVELRLGPRRPLPKDTYYPPRKRYRADRLLDHLDKWLPDDCDRIVGITRKDISTTKGKHKDWGILGLGRVGGASCVVSSLRTKKKLGRVSVDERLARVAIHELGHTLGLSHCPNLGCLMEDAGGSVVTIDREIELCDRCQRELNWRGDPPAQRPQP